MKRPLLKTLAILAGVVFVAVSAAAIYVARTWNRTYDAPLPNVHASKDPIVIARGEYLVFGPSHCVECHTTREEAADAEKTGGRPRLIGGRPFTAPPLGTIYTRNLTPDVDTGIGRYTDPQIARMLRYSVRPHGQSRSGFDPG